MTQTPDARAPRAKCPICERSFPLPRPGESLPPAFPFCSERCRLVDLNRWIEGVYTVPGEPLPPDDPRLPEQHPDD